MRKRTRPGWRTIATGAVVVLLLVGYLMLRGTDAGTAPQPAPTTTQTASTDEQLGRLFATQQSDVEVTGVGWVTRLLADDTEGGRHQRFILQLASGQTLLVAHNIDVAPRLDGLAVGDRVAFRGEYVYTDQGGTIHWTHHDPGGTHTAGWLDWNGRRYG